MDSDGEYGFSMINSGMEWALAFEVPKEDEVSQEAELNSSDVRFGLFLVLMNRWI